MAAPLGTPQVAPSAGAEPQPDPLRLVGGPTRDSVQAIAAQTGNSNLVGATPFMDTPGMQIASEQGYDPGQTYASQRVRGETIHDDPAVSAALQDFYARTQPQIQNAATRMGLGRSTAALNAINQAQGSMLRPLYESAMGRENERIGRMTQQGQFEAGLSQQNLSRLSTAAENEMGRGERSSGRIADANQNMAQMLAGLSNTMYGRNQTTGQGLMSAGNDFRGIGEQMNAAAHNDFLRRQALGEQAVLTPFGGLASAGMGSQTLTSGK